MNSPTEPTQGEIEEALIAFESWCLSVFTQTAPTGGERNISETTQAILSLLKRQDRYARADEMLRMPIGTMDDPDDDTNVFWYRTYTMPEYESRMAELKSKNEE